MTKPVRRVVIAGGGTAGWLAAAALAQQLGPAIDITLVESDAIGTVGVGEATIPTIRAFHNLLGLGEREFLAATGATFKLAIRFEDWARIGDGYFHSFGQVGRSTWLYGFQHMWLRARAAGAADALDAYCYETGAAAAGRFALAERGGLNYAYHLDATRYAALLRARAEASGVTRIEGRIADVPLDGDSGDIAALVLDDGRRVEGDLFLDCTGFSALLIERALGVGFEDWSHWLPTDRAIAVQTEATGPAPPWTLAKAHDAGWRWRIPLQHRIGNGIVYASAHLSDEDARDRLLAAIGGRPLTEPRVIRYRTGRRRAAWAKNCVAIGLSGGFVEPLESTSIHLIMIAITRLVQSFPARGATPALAGRFNDLAAADLEDVRDFIIAHYHLTQRDDSPFWQRMRSLDVPESLARRIALFRDEAQLWQDGGELFRTDSWLQVMLGQRLEPAGYHPSANQIPAADLKSALAELAGGIAGAVTRLPAHQAFLDRYLAGGPQPR